MLEVRKKLGFATNPSPYSHSVRIHKLLCNVSRLFIACAYDMTY